MKKDSYLEFVKSEAEKNGKIFMIDSGEGRDFEDSRTGWYIEDLTGWLIDKGQEEKFLIERNQNKAYDAFGDSYILVEWFRKDDGQIGVNFKKIPVCD